MKKEGHPQYHLAKVQCACGNAFETHAWKPEVKIDVCNLCHPFFSGKMKIMDSEGRVERFKKKYSK